jgi:hypothetical protein
MNSTKSTWDELLHQADQQANTVDYSNIASKALFSEHMEALKQLNRLPDDLAVLADVRMQDGIHQRPDVHEDWYRALELITGLFVYLNAVAKATAKEIFRRAAKNRTNRNFALLGIGEKIGDSGLQVRTYRQLRNIGSSIVQKKNWHHPNGPEEFQSILNETLTKELNKFRAEGPEATFVRMLDNRFGYIYNRIVQRYKDEWRKYYRSIEGRNDRLGPEEANDIAGPSLQERTIERLATIKLIEVGEAEATEPGVKATFREANRLLSQPFPLSGMTSRNIHAALIRAIASSQGVSIRQASNYVRSIERIVDSNGLQLFPVPGSQRKEIGRAHV